VTDLPDVRGRRVLAAVLPLAGGARRARGTLGRRPARRCWRRYGAFLVLVST
jgi:hypothetical protein